jgi:hypothetical protein
MATMTRKNLPIWARPRPGKLGETQSLTAAQKRKAKARAAAAGRKYPNLIDNIAAVRNPTMKKPSPAQLAARKRFAEMARSGAFKKKTTRRKANPTAIKWQMYDEPSKTISAIINGSEVLITPIKKSQTDFYEMPVWTRAILEIGPEKNLANEQFPFRSVSEAKFNAKGQLELSKKMQMPKEGQHKANPAKKTVSQKISQLRHEGYPQRQAVAVALSEQRAGKVKRNPMGEIQAYAITRNFKVLGIFQTKQDAIKAAQGISDATGKTLAIKPVQVMAGHFNK